MSSNFMDTFLGNKYATDAVSSLSGYGHPQHRMYPYASLSPQSSVAVSGTLYYTSNADLAAKSCRYSSNQGNGLDISASSYAFNLQNCGVTSPAAAAASAMMAPAQFLPHPATDLASTISPCSQLGYRQLDPIPDVPRYPWMTIAGWTEHSLHAGYRSLRRHFKRKWLLTTPLPSRSLKRNLPL